ncbi:MAG: ATP-binding cassette domain-containing protein, partial [Actinomycetaceae bacterium]|nr:ATP-binding cassette domain-containing protein [Actinomycetaceae bacterium]
MSILQAESITKVYGKRTVVHDMSFAVPAQSITALTGPSGSGKSTILNMIGMLESIDGGRILLGGKPLPSINSRAATRLRREHINYLFQSFALISDITVRENLLLAMKYVDKSKKEKNARIDEALESLGIRILGDSPVN